jgi:hypothetical protein
MALYKKSNNTKTFHFGQYWQEYSANSVEVPKYFTLEQAVQYVKDNWDDIGINFSGSEYIDDSAELDEDGIEFMNEGFDEREVEIEVEV